MAQGTDDSRVAAQRPLIRALEDPAVYGHGVTGVEVVETHISWVMLTGEYAYKIKKAVNFGFLDYSTLEKRRDFCRQELRLNRRFAPQLYLDVVAIGGTPEAPLLQGGGEPIEYAVRMNQFPSPGLLSSLAARQALTQDHIDELAQLLPAMQAIIDVADRDSGYGLPEDIHHWVMENFDHIRPALRDSQQRRQLDVIDHWCRREFAAKRGLIQQRLDGGFVREGHGDLHLGNLTLVNGLITPFDGIEFNPQLRWIDIMSELAFLLMDIQDRGYPQLSSRLLNETLQHSGDYAGLALLRYYLVYRALVRAKVAVLRQLQAKSTLDRYDAWHEYAGYMELASRYVAPPQVALIITHGVSGTGKSTHAARLAQQLGALQIRSDIERKRLHGYDPAADTRSGIKAGIYSADASERTYERLAGLARTIIEAGYPVIVDATFLQTGRREQFHALSRSLAVPFVLLHFEVDVNTLRERIQKRQAAGGDPSEAGLEVLEAQLASQEPLTPDEMAVALVADPDKTDALYRQVAGKLHAVTMDHQQAGEDTDGS